MEDQLNYDKKLKPRPKWSSVWLHCTDLQTGKAICNICSTVLAYHSHLSTSTYNLKRHLRLKHPTLGLNKKKRSAVGKLLSLKLQRHSTVWNNFTIVSDHKVKCDICGIELVYLNASTHNLKRHLQAVHTPEELNKYSRNITVNASATNSDKKLPSAVLCSAITVALANNSNACDADNIPAGTFSDDDNDVEFVKHKPTLSGTKQRMFNESLLEMITLDYQPVCMVNDVGFRDFVSQLQPAYLMPRDRTVSDIMLPQRFDRLLNRRKIEMFNAIAVCLTIEGWSTEETSHRYFAVTGHFISDELEMKSYMMDCLVYTDQHTITYLKDELMRVVEEWSLQDKVVAVVTDNIGEVLTAIELIGWTRLPCLTHTLNSIANDALAEIDEILTRIRSIVEYFRYNTTASAMLQSVMRHMELPETDLVQDVAPYWTSTYHMMHRFLEVRDPVINTLSLLLDPVVQVLSWADWDVIARACQLLMALYEAAIEISAEKYMSASKAMVMIKGLLRFCNDQLDIPDQPPTIERMANIMMSSMSTWFGNLELKPLFAEATMLDPRFKQSGFSDSNAAAEALRGITEAANQDLGEKFQHTIIADSVCMQTVSGSQKREFSSSVSVWDDYDQKVSSIVMESAEISKPCTSVPGNNCTPEGIGIQPATRCSVWSDYDQKISDMSTVNIDTDITKQIQRFLDEPLLSRQESCLEWWHSRMPVYPCLMSVVRERLCLVATSVSSEHIFSTTGLVLNDRRRHLDSCEVRHRVFLNANLLA